MRANGKSNIRQSQPEPQRNTWLRWQNFLYNLTNAVEICVDQDTNSLTISYASGAEASIPVEEHPHIKSLIEQDPALKGQAAAIAMGMVHDALIQSGSGSINLWSLIGTLQKSETKPVPEGPKQDTPPEENAVEGIPDVIPGGAEQAVDSVEDVLAQ